MVRALAATEDRGGTRGRLSSHFTVRFEKTKTPNYTLYIRLVDEPRAAALCTVRKAVRKVSRARCEGRGHFISALSRASNGYATLESVKGNPAEQAAFGSRPPHNFDTAHAVRSRRKRPP